MLKVLIVDDQPAVCTALQMLLEVNGLSAITTCLPSEALDVVRREEIGVLIQDMNFTQDEKSGREGVQLFHDVRQVDPDLPVLLMTAWTSLETAVRLIKEGASDYVAKPWDDDKLVRSVRNLLAMREAQVDNLRLRAQASRARRALAERADLRGLVYASEVMHEAVSLAVNIASADVPVLITGANGSGKEMVADILQANSRRARAPFIKVNAGALPHDLIEAELFGAEAGAYTGAHKVRVGRFEAAHGGTLFLDEIGNLPPAGQAKLLRVLQTGEFERLGSSQTRRVDVRIVSATNIDLQRAIAAGQFREDLYFRLDVIEIRVPSLAERADDVLFLADHFLATLPGAPGEAPRLTDAARQVLLQHDWPGNVRELANRIQRAKLVCQGGAIGAADLGLGGGRSAADRPRAATPVPGPGDGPAAPERAAIEDALLRAGGIVARAAAELGLSRQALYRRMERLGIQMERRPRVDG